MYPQPVMGTAPVQTNAGHDAETFILLGFIFQILCSAAILFFAFLFFFVGFVFVSIALIAALIIGCTVLMLYVAFAMSYQRAKRGDYAGAKAPTLLLGILGLIFGFLITGIFYIIAYVKLGEAERERASPMIGVPMAMGTVGMLPAGGVAYAPAPMYMVAPMQNYAAAPPLASSTGSPPFCHRCGKPTTFVPQYGRYYCYTCSLYA